MNDPITCSSCLVGLQSLGTRDFHEGTRWGVLGEHFVDGIGEELRPHADV